MKSECKIYRAMEKIRSGGTCNTAFIGGSVTVATGASNNTATTWRRLFVEYLYTKYHPVYHCQPGEIMCAVGAMESFAGVTLIERNVARQNPDLCFVEFAINDRGAPDKELVKKGVEGIIRQLKSLKTTPDVVLIGGGRRKGDDSENEDFVDHTLHREIADYYGLGFIDVQEYIYRKLQERGQSWDDVAVLFLDNDSVHLNDYGNMLWFEAMREWFEQQERFFMQNPATGPGPHRKEELPVPLYYDEYQYTRLIDPSRKKKSIVLEGSWEKKNPNIVPWYMDNLLVGTPGDTLTFTFKGTAVGLWTLVYQNGLKIEAVLDGKEIRGAFTKFHLQFGKFFTLAHGLENREHTLRLTVAPPSAKLHKLENPTAEIGYIAIAQPPE